MENIINIINKLEKSTKSTLSSLQNSYSPHYIDIDYTVVNKVINYGLEKCYQNKTIIRLNNFDSILIKRISLNDNLLSLMENGIVKYFLFIVNEKIYPLSMIDIISDDRYTYLLINNRDIVENIKLFLFPFKIKYIENKYEYPYDIDFTFEIYNNYKNNITINLLNNCNIIKEYSVPADSYFTVETNDIKYRIFKDNILFMDNSKYNIIKYNDIEEYPINIFKINKTASEPDVFYYYAFYNKNIIDEQFNFINKLLTNENLYDYLINNVDLQEYDLDFIFNKNLSYEDNINNVTNYILGYDPILFNSLLSNKNIEKKYYTGSELLAIKDNNDYVNFSNYRNGSIENYVIIYINGFLYDYHELIIRNHKGIRVKLININPEDKIEIVWYYGVDNKNYTVNIPSSEYEYIGFKDYIKDNINTLEIFIKSLLNRIYDIPESNKLLYKIDYHLSNNNKSISFLNDFHYNKDIILSSKRQYRYMRLNVTIKEESSSVIDLTDDFLLCNNIDQYMVFINNKFQSSDDYLPTINKYDNPIDRKCIYLSSPLQIGDQIDIFYIPYPYRTIELSKDYEIIDNGIIQIDNNKYLSHPYNKNINDIFINSTKIHDIFINVASSNIIKIISSVIKYDKNIIILDYINEYLALDENIFSDHFNNNDNIRNILMTNILDDNVLLMRSLYNDFDNISITEQDYKLHYYLKITLLYHIILNFYIKLFNMIDASDYFSYSGDSSIIKTLDLNKHEYTSINVDGNTSSEESFHIVNYLENNQIEIKKINSLGYSIVYLSDIDINVENDVYSASVEVVFNLQEPHINDINKLINIRYIYTNGTIIDNKYYMLYDEDMSTDPLMGLPIIFRTYNINKNNDIKKVQFYITLYNKDDKITITKPLSIENIPYPSDKTGIIPIDPKIQTLEKLPYNWEEYGII